MLPQHIFWGATAPCAAATDLIFEGEGAGKFREKVPAAHKQNKMLHTLYTGLPVCLRQK